MSLQKKAFRKKWFLTATAVNLLLVVTFFLHVPLESYVGSSDSLWFSFGDVAPMIFLVSAGVFLLLEAAAALLPIMGVKIMSALVFTLGLCLYLQITFLNPSFGLLGAQFADTSQQSATVYTNLIFWIAMFLILPGTVMVLNKRKLIRQGLCAASALLVIMQLVSIATLAITKHEKLFPAGEGPILTSEGMFTSGEEEGSLLLFVVDTLDSQYFEAALEAEPQLAEAFDGFTRYANSTGSYTKTWGALPYIVSGVPNTNQVPLKDYRREAYTRTSLFKTLEEAGYDTRIFTGLTSAYNDPLLLEHLDNTGERQMTLTDPLGLYLSFMKYVGFRTFPEILKPLVYIDGYGFNAICHEVAQPNWTVQFDPAYYKELQTQGITAVEGRTFRMYHLWGPHDPYLMDENGQYDPNSTADRQAIGSLKILRDHFAAMKEAGVYDNAAIMVVGDHSRYLNGESIFMVKTPHSTGPMTVSQAPVCHGDIHNTLFDAAGLPLTGTGGSALRIPQDAQRVRTAWLYRPELMWEYQPDYLPPMYEVHYGNDPLAPEYTGRVYLPGKAPGTLGDVARTAEKGVFYGYDALTDFFCVDSLMTGSAQQGYRHLNMRRGKMYFKVPHDHTGDVHLTLTFAPELAVSPSRLTIACADQVLFDQTFEGAMTETVSLTVDAALVDNGLVALDILTPDAVMLRDHSVISFALKGLTLQ